MRPKYKDVLTALKSFDLAQFQAWLDEQWANREPKTGIFDCKYEQLWKRIWTKEWKAWNYNANDATK